MTPVLDRSTAWPYEDGEPGEFTYSRFSSPTVAEAERALGELDGGEALLFASGTAAATGVVLALLAPGKTVALAAGAYYGTGVLLDELARWGLDGSSSTRRASHRPRQTSSGSKRLPIHS